MGARERDFSRGEQLLLAGREALVERPVEGREACRQVALDRKTRRSGVHHGQKVRRRARREPHGAPLIHGGGRAG